MDRLIDDYKKALAEEFELQEPVDRLIEHVRKAEAYRMVRLIETDPKLPQWKAQEIILIALDQQEGYPELRQELRNAERDYGLAEIRLAVAHERIELTKARLYGEHHDLLDMQEVEQAPNEIVD